MSARRYLILLGSGASSLSSRSGAGSPRSHSPTLPLVASFSIFGGEDNQDYVLLMNFQFFSRIFPVENALNVAPLRELRREPKTFKTNERLSPLEKT